MFKELKNVLNQTVLTFLKWSPSIFINVWNFDFLIFSAHLEFFCLFTWVRMLTCNRKNILLRVWA